MVVVVDNDTLPKFTLEEYIAYLEAPQWVRDGCDDEKQYTVDLCSKVSEWFKQSEDAFKEQKDIWKLCFDELKKTPKKSVGGTTEDAIANAKIPILKNAMLDEIAALYSGQYSPILKSLADPTKPMIALSNLMLKTELKLNKWDTLKFKLGADAFVTDLWVLKIITDDEAPGPFGENERIVWHRIDPMNCYWDPAAREMIWSEMDFFIVKEEMDLGVAKARFRDKARLIDESLADVDRSNGTGSGLYMTPGSRKRWAETAARKRVDIKECWLHDERMIFRAHKEVDEEGNDIIKLDEEGFVEGSWEKAYPDGRMIVTAGDKVVLRDIPNPYWHKDLPFVFCQYTPAAGGELISVGKAASILGIERKVNDVESRLHSYAQAETERPMEAEVGTFPNNMAWYNTTGQSRNILVKTQGKSFIRRPAVEPPIFLGPYLSRLYNYNNQTLGQGGILRGEVAEGAQLSAQAVQNMQGTGMARMSMQSIQIAGAMKEAGEKTFWLQRETYSKDLKAMVTLPGGGQEEIVWNDKDVPNDIFVDMDIAANTPGGHSMQVTQALNLKREGCADRAYVLQTIGVDDWQAIDKRMKDREEEKIMAQGFARAFGVQVKNLEKENDGPGPNQKPR